MILGVPGEGISQSDEFIYYMLPGVVFFVLLCAWEGILSHLFFFPISLMQSQASPIFDFHRYFGTAIPKAKLGKRCFFFDEGETG